MKIEIYVLGGIKTKFIKDGIQRYIKWLKNSFKIELKEFNIPWDLNKMESELYKMKCYEIIKDYVEEQKANIYKIALDEKGKQMSSTEFAKFIENLSIHGYSIIRFFLGSPLGHSKKIFDKVHLSLSISKMTFTHEMATLLITEQIYRAFKIIRGEKYHY